jgi:lipopolysaccharide transport system ATP-binding protein
MKDEIITVDNLSKRYVIGHQTQNREQYTALRDVIARETKTFARKAVDLFRGRQVVQGDELEEFWALRNICFEIKRGEIVGIIGRNGAGKSTLLKILSRITEPTKGKIVLRGRVGSLLEVGTGFHPELTGRENIFLNGAILGMTQREVRKKFDEIVAFSETERFLDTPVKRYSSGMYVRLAFAVAAHLEPEILVVDEVLSVGDAEFQKKCLGKIEDISRGQGRTVLFVSHNLSAVANLCTRGIVLDSGSVVTNGSIAEAITAYLSQGPSQAIYISTSGQKSAAPHVKRIEVVTSESNSIHQSEKSLEVRFWISHQKPMYKPCFSFNIVNQFQQAVTYAYAFNPEFIFGAHQGETLLTCKFPTLRLNIGRYHIRTHLSEPPGMEFYEMLDGLCPFEVVRTEDTRLWGWHPGSCTYFEDWNWRLEQIS